MIKKRKQGTLLLRARVRARHHTWRQILSGGFCMRHVMNTLRRIFCFIRHDNKQARTRARSRGKNVFRINKTYISLVRLNVSLQERVEVQQNQLVQTDNSGDYL